MIINGFGGKSTMSTTLNSNNIVSTQTYTLTQTTAISGSTYWPSVSPGPQTNTNIYYSVAQTTTSYSINVGDLLSAYEVLVLYITPTQINPPSISFTASYASGSGGGTFTWPFRLSVYANYGNSDYAFMPFYYRDCTATYTTGTSGSKTVSIPTSSWGAMQTDNSYWIARPTINRVGLDSTIGEWAYIYDRIANSSSNSSILYKQHNRNAIFTNLDIRLGLSCTQSPHNVNTLVPSSPSSFNISGGSVVLKYDIYGLS